jgi:hypothetical protein
VYLRVDSTGSPASYRSLIAYLNGELERNKKNDNAVYFDYFDLDEMIDDGWAVD